MSIEYGILGLLSRRSMHGYELKEELEAEIGSHFNVNYGSLYRTLERLEKNEYIDCKLIEQKRFPDRKVYNLLPKGKEHFADWLLTPITGSKLLKNDFYIKLILSFTSAVDPNQVIDIQRKADISLMQALTKLKNSSDEKLQIRWILLLEAAIFQTEARLKWLELCRCQIKDLSFSDRKQIKAEKLKELYEIETKIVKGG